MEFLFAPDGELTYAEEPAALRNVFHTMAPHFETLPTYESAKERLPEPIWDGHDDVIACYRKAWEIAFSNLRNPTDGSGFVSPFIDTAFNGFLFMWDSAFIVLFGRYGSKAFDFRQTLDNFYAVQHKDGFICREVCESEHGGHFTRHDPAATGPNILSFAEWEYYRLTANRERLEKVFDPLLAYHRWLQLNHTWRDGTYWSSGWGCGMDNIPRLQKGYNVAFSHGHQIWADACMQAILDAKILVSMAKVLGREAETIDLVREIEALTEKVNRLLWSDEDAFYYDLWKNGEPNRVKHIGAYWALLADIVPSEKREAFIAHLENESEFNRPHPFPSLSADHPCYNENGDYWRGGVWAPTNYMVFKGLQKVGKDDLAHKQALRHLNAVVETFRNTGTLWENYSPEQAKQGIPAKDNFVGWTGLVPISVLFENVFGIDANPVEKTIVWDIRLAERHGIRRYPFGEGEIDLICEACESATDSPVLSVRAATDTPFRLIVRANGKTEEFHIAPSTSFSTVRTSL